MSEDFIKLSDQQKERRKQHIYPHRLSRKGYARLAEEIATELCDDDDINRAIMWKKGRVNKKGDFEGEDLTKIVQKIDDYIQQKREGKLKIEGTNEDILTKALETGENAGRVRGIGGHITPTMYFKVGTTWKSVDVAQDLMTEHKRELMEAKKKILEQDARILKLEALVYKKGVNEISSDDKASCSVHLHRMNENDMEIDDDLQIVREADTLQGKPVALKLDSSTNIAAYGTIVCVNGSENLVHGAPLPKNCMRVAIDEAVDKSGPLSFPIPSECEVIGDAVGTYVAWPQHLIVKQVEKPRRKIFEQPKKKHNLSTSVPRSLRMLYCYSMRALQEGNNISVILEHDVFDDDYELILHLEDIIPLCQLEAISGNSLIGYIWHLYKNMMTDIMKEKFKFVNPHSIPYIATTTRDKKGNFERLNLRASQLADRLSCASVDQLVLVPCNVGNHWILTVIEPYKEVVYLLNSLSHRMRYEDWKYVVEMALRLFNSNKGRKGRKKPVWEIVQVPRQPDAKQCGYYVIRFMRQLIEEAEIIERDALRSIFTAAKYSREEINEVRSELAECIQDHIYE